jgi:hypothetical protein
MLVPKFVAPLVRLISDIFPCDFATTNFCIFLPSDASQNPPAIFDIRAFALCQAIRHCGDIPSLEKFCPIGPDDRAFGILYPPKEVNII